MFDEIKSQWNEASSLRRIVFVVGLTVLLLMLSVSAYWTLREDYQVLFSDLSAQDASVMVGELDRLKVPYQLADNGSTILVEQEAVYKTRLKLMGQGLNLNGSVGFEIFNNSEFGMTEFAQKVNYQRALQGELARTIIGFDEVKSARVHLVLPESGLFKRQNAKPKASVSVLVKDGHVLSQDQVSGIQRLVAASVPEISPSEVTVMDHRGVAVTKLASAQDGDAALYDRLDMKRQLEEYMVRKIVNVVDRAVGPGKAIVSVDVSLNYDQIKVTREDIVPLQDTSGQDVGAVVRRRESTQAEDMWRELATSSQSQETGNMMPSSSSIEMEFTNSRRVEQVLSSPGNITRLSVGVLVPDSSDQVKIAKLKEMISMAVGINAARGDGFVVYGVDLPQATDSEAEHFSDVDASATDIASVNMNPQSKLPAGLSGNNLILIVSLLAAALLFFVFQFRTQGKEKAKIRANQREKLLAEISQWASDAKRI